MNKKIDHKELQLTKLSLEELYELCEREKQLLQNKKIINSLPDKGKQLEDKLARVKKELETRKNVKTIAEGMEVLSLACPQPELLQEKHIHHICSLEKSPNKERYKPFSTLVHKDEKKNKTDKPTVLIPLPESMTLLVEQATKLPIEQVKKVLEGSASKTKSIETQEDLIYSEGEGEEGHYPGSDSEGSEKT